MRKAARGTADEGSDIDVLALLDLPRETIAEQSWQIGSIASDLSMDCGVMVSPIVESRSFYESRVDLLPFFSAVNREGVRLSA